MFLQASQIIGRLILLQDEDGHLGTVERLVIDPADGRVRALGVRPTSWFAKEQFVSTNEIVGVEKEGFVIRDETQLTGLDELVRVAEILKQKIPIIGQPARTVSGQSLGTIDDVLIDINLWVVAKYYLRTLLDERILPSDQVESITKEAIIFLDQTMEPTATAIQPTTAEIA